MSSEDRSVKVSSWKHLWCGGKREGLGDNIPEVGDNVHSSDQMTSEEACKQTSHASFHRPMQRPLEEMLFMLRGTWRHLQKGAGDRGNGGLGSALCYGEAESRRNSTEAET